MRKQTEFLLWILAVVALANVVLTDPIAFDFIKRWWIYALVPLLVLIAACTISFLCGVAHGRKVGRSQGYRIRQVERRQ